MIEELVRQPGRGPAPRGLPCLGLESTSGTGSHLLDALAAHGIFRKYETVLDLAGGIGGTGRWLAARLGCTAVVTADAVAAAVGARLTRLARLRGQVAHVPARPDALPFGDARFTHVWAIEVLTELTGTDAVLREVFRVLRPGGHVAVQELVQTSDPRAVVEASAWCDRLVAAGFVDVTMRETADVAEHSAQVAAARQQLAARLATSDAGSRIVASRRRLGDALAAGRLRVAQLVARRP